MKLTLLILLAAGTCQAAVPISYHGRDCDCTCDGSTGGSNGGSTGTTSPPPASAPEPATLVVWSVIGAACAVRRWRKGRAV